MNWLIKAFKDKQRRKIVNIKFGMNIPRERKKEIMFNVDNVNTNWEDSELLELKQIYNLDPFDYIGPINSARIPPVYTNIQLHIIFYYKQYGRYKAHMVASGHMNGPNLDTYYSRVISLCSMRTIVFLSIFNNI